MMTDHPFLTCPTPLLVPGGHRGQCHHPGCIYGPERHTEFDNAAMIDGKPYEICRTCCHGWPVGEQPYHGLRCPSGPGEGKAE